jgi:hypothetical protein
MKAIANKTFIMVLGLIICLVSSLAAQETTAPAPAQATEQGQPANIGPIQLRLNAYLEAFDTVDLDGKLQILDTAANDPIQEVFALYQRATRFLVDNGQQIPTNTQLQQMVRAVVPRILEAQEPGLNGLLWQLFLAHDDVQLRLVILATLGPLSADDAQMRINLTTFLQNQLRSRQAGTPFNVQLALGLVEALGNILRPEVQMVLVDTVIARIDANVTRRAFEIITEIGNGSTAQPFFEAFRIAQGNDKGSIFNDYIQADFVSTSDKVQFSSLVLNNVLSTTIRDASLTRMFLNIRTRAVEIIADNNQPEFAPVLIRHFNDAIVGFDRGTLERSVVIDAVAALGSTNSPVAARRLTEFLTLINSYTQQDRPYDRQITLNVIENLGILANVESFNALFMVTILNYPNTIKEAARTAIAAISR